MNIMNDLSDDAVRAESGLLVISRQPEYLTDQFTQPVVIGAGLLFNDPRQSRCGLCELVGHQSEVQGRSICSHHGLQHRPDHFPQDFLGRPMLTEHPANVFSMGRVYGTDQLPQDLGVQPHLAAEVIVDGRDIGTRAGTDLADRGTIISPLGKDFSGRIEQLSMCGVGRDGIPIPG